MLILTVEDEASTATLFRMLFKTKLNASVDTAPDCASARELLSSGSYDLVTLDYQLPDGDGLSLLEEIAAKENAPPVVMVTGHGDEKTAVSAFKLGASGYVVKDARMSTLLIEEARSALARAGRAKAEEETEKANTRLSVILSGVEEAICTYDMDRHTTSCNRAALEMLGYTEEEIVGRDVRMIYPSEEAYKALGEAVYPELKKKGRYRGNTDLRRKSGEVFPVEFFTRLMILGGETVGVLSVFRDITERKQAEEALRVSEETLQTIFDSMPGPIFFKDKENRFIRVNRTLCESLEKSEEELIGRSGWELFPDYAEEYWEDDLEVIESGEPKLDILEPLETPQGTRWYRTDKVPYRDADGETIGVIGFSVDVTERREAEEALRERETHLEAILEVAMDAIFLIDNKIIIRHWNPAAEKLFGFTGEEALGQSFAMTFPGPSYQAYMIALDKFINTGQRTFTTEVPSEMTFIGKDGIEFSAEVSVSRLQIGDEWYCEVIARDITNRKVFEEALERANAELAGYAHTVSHDLKGPVSAASLAFDMLMSALEEDEVPPEKVEMLREIAEAGQNNVRNAHNLIESLLALAEAGEPQDVSTVSIEETIRKVLTNNAEMIKERGITVKVASPLGSVVASPTQIYQLFANLIGNTIKHNKAEDPIIEISSLGVEGTTRTYLVRDNGQGIPDEVLDNVFIPFAKARSSDSGIGLSIVEKIVQTYGGEIRAYNDSGACFEFTLKDSEEAGL